MTDEGNTKLTGVLSKVETLLREGITLDHLALVEGLQTSIAKNVWSDEDVDAKREALVARLIARFREDGPFGEDRLGDPDGYLLHIVLTDAARVSQRRFVEIGMDAWKAKERAKEATAYATSEQAYFDCLMPRLEQGMTLGEAVEAYEQENPDTPLPERLPRPDWFDEEMT